MSIFRSTNPLDFDQVDGIIIDESAPSPNIAGVATNIAILVGQFQRGPLTLKEVASTGEFYALYGKSSYSGNNELLNKKFGRLRIVRVDATGAAVASLTVTDGGGTPVSLLTFFAKEGKGVFGNGIQVTVAAGSLSGRKYTIHDTDPNAQHQDEVYDNVVITAIDGTTFAQSALITAAVLATTAEPAVLAATNLASGSDGTASDVNYQTAIGVAEVEAAGNMIALDSYNTTRNGYLKVHVADTQDKMAILAGPQTQAVSAAVTDVANYRDVDGRMIYSYPWVQTVINGSPVFTSPSSWYMSLLSQIGPNIDPAYAANSQFLQGMTDLKLQLKRNDYIQLKDAGISAFEFDADIGFKIKTGCVTQIANSSKTQVLRRRMADFLTTSAGKFLKNYQNAPNTKANRTAVNAAISTFVQLREQEGVLPSDKEVTGGKAKLIDTESLNTDASIAQGFFKILWRQRIFSSMRFIVLQAEIGESVVVTDVS